MAFSDLCLISNAFKTVENEPDQSDRIMEENSMVRDLITKILDETGPSEGSSSIQPSDKTISIPSSVTQFPKNDTACHTSFIPPPTYNTYQDPMYNFTQSEQNNFNFNMQNGFGSTNGFVNYPDGDLLNIDPVDTSETVTPEQLNLLRLAAQEIGGAQFTSPNNDKFYNFFEPNQRNLMPEANIFSANNFNRPNSLNLDMNYGSSYDNYNMQRFPNKFENAFIKDQNQSQDSNDMLTYLNQLNISLDRPRDEVLMQNALDFKMPLEMNGQYQDESNKMYYNRNYPPKNYQNGDGNFFANEMMKMSDRNPTNQNYDFTQNSPVSTTSLNYKPNGFNLQNDFMQRRDMNQMLTRDGYPVNGMNDQRTGFDGVNRDGNLQQAAMMRQTQQEFARQMSLLMRSRPPPSQLNVDVSFLHENSPFNLGVGAILGPSSVGPVPAVGPVGPVLPSPACDLPVLAPFYAIRNIRGAATSSGTLHARLDACYEQWRQLETERKRTEAELARAYPGRAVSSSNSIPVPRLPPCPTRVDRLTVDMLREHTKVLTLMGKMETLRASLCVAQNKKLNKHDDPKITVLKRGQENVASEKENGSDTTAFDPATWRDDVKNLSEIAPHSEVESAMLSWRNAVTAVQVARRRELNVHTVPGNNTNRYMRTDPILQLADAVKQLGICARRARCAMWCDLTLTVALAPKPETTTVSNNTTVEKSQTSSQTPTSKMPETLSTNTSTQSINSSNGSNGAAKTNNDVKEDKPAATATESATKSEKSDTTSTSKPTNKQSDKQQDKNQHRRTQNYRHKLNQGRHDFYAKNQRYDNRFMQSRHPYHYLATGPIN